MSESVPSSASPASSASTPSRSPRSLAPKKLTLLSLIATTYFMVSGGAYGLEDLVASGYFVAVVALLITPIVWSLPTALMVGELASALPEEGGYYAWVRRALGPFWGFQEAWLSLTASFFDMAIYPTIFTLYLGRLVPWVASGPGTIVVGAAMIAVCTAWNIRGAASVGTSAAILTAALLAPFVVFSVMACVHPHIAHVASEPAVASTSGLLPGILVAMWNYMGWDSSSTIAAEVEHPGRTYPLAMLGAVALVAITYIVPVGAAAIARLDPHTWTTGAWVLAAHDVGGEGLALAVVVGGMVCGVGMFNALLLSCSRLPVALAEDGYLPAWLTRRSARGGAPWAAIVACSVAYAACLGIGFSRLIELDILLYGTSLVLEFVALVVLRVREPQLARPFKLPGGLAFVTLLGVGPLVLLGIAVWAARDETLGPMPALLFGAILVALGPLVYAVRTRGKKVATLAGA